jgi:hypothetical protein
VWLGGHDSAHFTLSQFCGISSEERKVRGVLRNFVRKGIVAVAAIALATGTAHAALIDVTSPGDPIVGIAATPGSATSSLATAGGGSGNAYPTAENPSNAIDNNQGDKYLNFQQSNAGFITTLLANGSSLVTQFRFSTGNDAAERDPATITIEGTNDANPTTTLNSTWTPLYTGVSGLATDPGRNTFGSTVTFVNTQSFTSYRLLVTSVRTPSSANSFQFGEVELIGTPAPEPGSVGLIGLAVGGLIGRRRRKSAIRPK